MNENILKAVTILRQGGLVAFPTETVYGLGADASNPEALKKIFAAKNRPSDHPLIVHIADLSELSNWANDISDAALLLAKSFWPGPLTLIFKKAAHVSDLVTGHQDTIGLRIPNHPLALELLTTFHGGVAAPSANKFGRISPTTANAVKEELGIAVDMILDGGHCEVGVESTILDVSSEIPVILRPGMITQKQIEQVLKKPILEKKKNSPRVSGSFELHYAPNTKTRIMKKGEINHFLQMQNDSIALLALSKLPVENKTVYCVMMPNEAKAYAHDLYDRLRELDKKNFREIIVESVPETEEWTAIRDRLMRASAVRSS